MKKSIFKLKKGHLSVLVISFLSSNGFASEGKHVTFDPSTKLLTRKMECADYSNQPALLKLQRESRALGDLSNPNGQLGRFKEAAMAILIPGDPWFDPDASRLVDVSFATIKSKSIEAWKTYGINECIEKLESVAQYSQYIADYADLGELIRTHYATSNRIAVAFLSAFERLRDGSSSADEIVEALNNEFRETPEVNKVRQDLFFAVDCKLNLELENAGKIGGDVASAQLGTAPTVNGHTKQQPLSWGSLLSGSIIKCYELIYQFLQNFASNDDSE
ncbi:MAG: hypothetical protein LBB05_01960 [Puniceicoccales bacterium]|jgi:hypothetical protein|nr:hypothetical protein [Puniceicoccales bacterium]